MDSFLTYAYQQPCILLVLSFVCAGIILINYHYTKKFCQSFILSDNKVISSSFDYGQNFGPHKWKELFPAARGCYQSPINIQTETTENLKIRGPLMWRNYDELPVKIILENTGHTVVMTAEYGNANQPTVFGAELLESYSFASLRFRWSALHYEGSEHSIDNIKYPLEMQVTHFASKNTNVTLIRECGGKLRTLAISYFFIVTTFDNPYLDPIISNLHRVYQPFKQVNLFAFPLSWLCYPFKSNFYSYGGSLTEPPCTEGVTWFVQPEPMSISENQLAEFRRLMSTDQRTRIVENSRPVQHLNSRIVFYNSYEQSWRLSETSTNITHDIQ